jgi:hypothetical protein
MNETPMAEMSGAGDDRDDQRHHERQRQHRWRRATRDARLQHHRERRERADHVDLAVGEVDQLDDAINERVAQRDEREQGAIRQAEDQHLNQNLGVMHQQCAPLRGVRARPGLPD